MKISKPLIYLFFVLLVVGTAAILINYNQSSMSTKGGSKNLGRMPDDEIHRNMSPRGASPGKVTPEFKAKIASLKSEIEANPQDTTKIKELANLLVAGHNPIEAIIYYEKLLKLNPQSLDTYFALSDIYYERQEYDRTLELTKKIIELTPSDERAYYNLGAVKASMNEISEAKRIWNEVIAKFPGTESAKLAADALNRI